MRTAPMSSASAKPRRATTFGSTAAMSEPLDSARRSSAASGPNESDAITSSSREKDLVDLIVFATQDIDGTALRVAITTETRRRKMEPFEHFTVPSTWGPGYTKLTKSVSYCADYPNVDLAAALFAQLVDPALVGDADGMAWDHTELAWRPSSSVPRAYPAT